MKTSKALTRLALFAALNTAFQSTHGFCDQAVQNSTDASRKRWDGPELVYADGTDVDEDPDRTEPTFTKTSLGRRHAAKHVASYMAVQTATAAALTRTFGYRVPASAFVAGAIVNGVTHFALDRGPAFRWLMKTMKKDGYVDFAQVVRMDDEGKLTRYENGPGTSWMELDEALHRYIGVGAAAVMTLIATAGKDS